MHIDIWKCMKFTSKYLLLITIAEDTYRLYDGVVIREENPVSKKIDAKACKIQESKG